MLLIQIESPHLASWEQCCLSLQQRPPWGLERPDASMTHWSGPIVTWGQWSGTAAPESLPASQHWLAACRAGGEPTKADGRVSESQWDMRGVAEKRQMYRRVWAIREKENKEISANKSNASSTCVSSSWKVSSTVKFSLAGMHTRRYKHFTRAAGSPGLMDDSISYNHKQYQVKFAD